MAASCADHAPPEAEARSDESTVLRTARAGVDVRSFEPSDCEVSLSGAFASYPDTVRSRVFAPRRLILVTAEETDGASARSTSPGSGGNPPV